MKTLIKTIWAIRVEQLERPALVAFGCHKLMKKQKLELAKRCKGTCKNNRPAMEVRYMFQMTQKKSCFGSF